MKELYISTPVKLEGKSRIVQSALEGIGYGVNNPCDIKEIHGTKEEMPGEVCMKHVLK